MLPTYPDISDLLRAKEKRRLALAALSWEEKVAILEQMRRAMPRGAWGISVVDEKLPGRNERDEREEPGDR